MLHPSYTELMERINKDVEEGDTPIVQSRYSIVKATADRAKQIIDSRAIDDKIDKQIKSDPMVEPVITDDQLLIQKKGRPLIDGNTDEMKPLSIAVEELYNGSVKIAERAEDEKQESAAEETEIPEDIEAETDSAAGGDTITDEEPEKDTEEAAEAVEEENADEDDKEIING